MSISRPDKNGFQVRVQRNGNKYSRYFSFRKFGSEDKALAAARAYEKQLQGSELYRHRPRRAAQKNNRSTGIVGVHFGSRMRRGIRIFEYKVSYWDPAQERQRRKTFYVGSENTYSEERDARVRARAISFRRASEQHIRSLLINENQKQRQAQR